MMSECIDNGCEGRVTKVTAVTPGSWTGVNVTVLDVNMRDAR